jgi:hypothetical protein
MSYILSRKYARKSDPDFVVAAARAIYCDYTLSRMDEKGTTPGQCELTEVLPETAPWAFNLARNFTIELWCLLCTGSKTKLPLDWNPEPSHLNAATDKLLTHLQSMPDNGHADRDRSDENLGWYAAMQAMGHGVGLRECGIDIDRLPHLEATP